MDSNFFIDGTHHGGVWRRGGQSDAGKNLAICTFFRCSLPEGADGEGQTAGHHLDIGSHSGHWSVSSLLSHSLGKAVYIVCTKVNGRVGRKGLCVGIN